MNAGTKEQIEKLVSERVGTKAELEDLICILEDYKSTERDRKEDFQIALQTIRKRKRNNGEYCHSDDEFEFNDYVDRFKKKKRRKVDSPKSREFIGGSELEPTTPTVNPNPTQFFRSDQFGMYFHHPGNDLRCKFWERVNEFFVPVHNDKKKLQLLDEQEIDPNLLEIPKVGIHYLQFLSEENSRRKEHAYFHRNNRQLQRHRGKEPLFVDVELASDAFEKDTLSQRLLQALVEEAPVTINGRDHMDFQPPGIFQVGITSTTDDYTSESISLMEDFLVDELNHLGMMNTQEFSSLSDNKHQPSNNDQVLEELQSLQKKLILQVQLTNRYRRKIKSKILAEKSKEEELLQLEQHDVETIRRFEKTFGIYREQLESNL